MYVIKNVDNGKYYAGWCSCDGVHFATMWRNEEMAEEYEEAEWAKEDARSIEKCDHVKTVIEEIERR